MPPPSRLDSISALYDSRSDKYDENQVHVDQARDYLVWADLRAGQNVLDLACGTGLVSIGAKSIVGDSGVVIGVDVSSGMLDRGRLKAERAGLQVSFIKGDIQHLDSSRFTRDSSSSSATKFDVITCASALILLDDPVGALRQWKTLLEEGGGKIVTDVQSRDANLIMNVFRHVAAQLGEKVIWDGGAARYESIEDLGKVVRDAGFEIEKLFETEPYATTHYKPKEAEEIFDEAVEKEMFERFGKPENGTRERARKLFVQRMNELAEGRENIKEETRYWVVVASVPASI